MNGWVSKATRIDGLDGAMAFGDAAALSVRARAEQLFAAADGVLDASDIRGVHDMRVASRRLRAVLEVFAPCFRSGGYKGVLKDVKALADALGERREPDVELARLTAAAAALRAPDRPGVELFAGRVRADQRDANAALEVALRRAHDNGLRERLLALADAARSGAAR